jgi:hypothetical protein
VVQVDQLHQRVRSLDEVMENREEIVLSLRSELHKAHEEAKALTVKELGKKVGPEKKPKSLLF